MYQNLKSICRESFSDKFRKIWAKYPLHPKKISSSYNRNINVFFGGSECINRAILCKELLFAQINIKGCFHTNWNTSHVSTLQNDRESCYVSERCITTRIFGNLGMECFSVVHSGIKNTPYMLHFLRSSDIGKLFIPFRLR